MSQLADIILGPASNRRHPHCLNCYKELTGKKDQKFCCQKCRDEYNNRIKAARRREEKKIIDPIKQNDKYLESLFKKDPMGEWPSQILQHPLFDGKAHYTWTKDDRVPFPGRRFGKYSTHEDPDKKTFKILYHG
jgi:hypothetical protein